MRRRASNGRKRKMINEKEQKDKKTEIKKKNCCSSQTMPIYLRRIWCAIVIWRWHSQHYTPLNIVVFQLILLFSLGSRMANIQHWGAIYGTLKLGWDSSAEQHVLSVMEANTDFVVPFILVFLLCCCCCSSQSRVPFTFHSQLIIIVIAIFSVNINMLHTLTPQMWNTHSILTNSIKSKAQKYNGNTNEQRKMTH